MAARRMRMQVVMSNWEARRLSQRQVSYAALDALVAGLLLRSLRLWHSSPSACAGCRGPPIGALVDCSRKLGCASPSVDFLSTPIGGSCIAAGESV